MDHKRASLTPSSFNDENANDSANPTFDRVLTARLSRRNLLRGTVGGAATALLASLSLAGCGGSDDDDDDGPAAPPETLLGFDAVGKSLADAVVVPAGYTASVLYALGDPLNAGTPAYANDGTDADFAADHGVGEYFGINVFLRDGDRVYRTYLVNGRGSEPFTPTWTMLDLTPFGRQEAWEDTPPGRPQSPPYSWLGRPDDYS